MISVTVTFMPEGNKLAFDAALVGLSDHTVMLPMLNSVHVYELITVDYETDNITVGKWLGSVSDGRDMGPVQTASGKRQAPEATSRTKTSETTKRKRTKRRGRRL